MFERLKSFFRRRGPEVDYRRELDDVKVATSARPVSPDVPAAPVDEPRAGDGEQQQ